MVEFGLANPWAIAIGLNSLLLGLAAAIPKKLLTPMGYVHAWILGVLVWATLGGAGYVAVMFYFLVGSGLTRVGKTRKEAAGIAEKRGGQRGPENVWGSAAAGTVCALSTLFANAELVPLLQLGYVASLATKLADTTASEIGKAYGKRTFLITSLSPVPPGTEGAVSLEGTLAGIAAAIALASVGWGVGLISGLGLLWSVLAALVATNVESWIGATLQSRYEWLSNEIVNGINTAIGALIAIALAWGWQTLS